MKTKLSILVIINNIEKLEKDLKKIIPQVENSNIEIILINKDNEEIDLKDLKKIYKNIKYVELLTTSDAEAYNEGMKSAEGKYIAFLTQGEYYSKGAIKKVYKYIKKEKAKIIAMKSVFRNNGIQKKYKICPNTNIENS